MYETFVENHLIFVDTTALTAWNSWSWLEPTCFVLLGLSALVSMRSLVHIALFLLLPFIGMLTSLIYLLQDGTGPIFELIPELAVQTKFIGFPAVISLVGALCVLLGFGIAWRTWNENRPRVAGGVLALLTIVVATSTLVLVQPVRELRNKLGRIGCLPHFNVESVELHVGRSRELTFDFTRLGVRAKGRISKQYSYSRHPEKLKGYRVRMDDGYLEGWFGKNQTDPRLLEVVAPDAPGPFTVVAEVSNGPVRVRREIQGHARAEIAHPGLPLAVGNTWEYEERQVARGGRLFGLLPWNQDGASHQILLEIKGTQVVDGFRQFELIQKRGELVEQRYWLRAKDGSTVLDREGKAIAWTPTLDPRKIYTAFDRSCGGLAFPGPNIEIPGPCSCAKLKTDYGSLFLSIITVGFITPPHSEKKIWVLKKTRAGTGESVESAPLPSSNPSHCPPTVPICIAGRISPQAGSLEKLQADLGQKGIETEITDEGSLFQWLVVRGKVEQLRSAKLRMSFHQVPGLCPNQSICHPTSRYLRSPRAIRSKIGRFDVNHELCSGENPWSTLF